MRHVLFALAMLFLPATAVVADVRVSIGIHVPVYPQLQRIPGYPVYYAPRLNTNYFFYDGLYWVFDGYDWYVSAWYNGPWELVDRFEVPVYLLRVPVRYYRYAPVYFGSWRADAPPRWGEHWGEVWVERRRGWDQWNPRSAPAPAPLPTYQRNYSGSRYPQVTEQVVIHTRNYRYQPKDTVVRQRFERFRAQAPTLQSREVTREKRTQRKSEQRAREERIEQRAARPKTAPPAQAQAKGWPGKGHEKALAGDRPAPPAQAQAKGWPGKGHEKALSRERKDDDDRPGRGNENRGRGRDK